MKLSTEAVPSWFLDCYPGCRESILSGVLKKKTTALHRIQDAFPSQSFAVLQSSTKQVFLEWDNEKVGCKIKYLHHSVIFLLCLVNTTEVPLLS